MAQRLVGACRARVVAVAGARPAMVASPMAHQGGWRSPAARTLSTASTKVKSFLEVEIADAKHEVEQVTGVEAMLENTSFKLDSAASKGTMLLLTHKNPDVLVKVEIHCTDSGAGETFDDMVEEGEEEVAEEAEDAEDAEEDSTEMESVRLDAFITKGGKTLLFECTAAGGVVEVDRLLVDYKEEEENDDTVYAPEFSELEASLQQSTDDFLAEHGVGTELAAAAQQVAFAHEQKLYLDWLNNFHAIVSKE